jgi:hypothetical protein
MFKNKSDETATGYPYNRIIQWAAGPVSGGRP